MVVELYDGLLSRRLHVDFKPMAPVSRAVVGKADQVDGSGDSCCGHCDRFLVVFRLVKERALLEPFGAQVGHRVGRLAAGANGQRLVLLPQIWVEARRAEGAVLGVGERRELHRELHFWQRFVEFAWAHKDEVVRVLSAQEDGALRLLLSVLYRRVVLS